MERVLPETADGASDATKETETACEAPSLPSRVVLDERVNQRVAHYLKTFTADDLKKYNPPSKHHCKTEDDFKAAHKKLHVFLHACMGKEGGVQRTYRYARGKDFGRMFCFEGMQNVWRAFRGALCKGLMTDIDMKNCHPVTLLWLCEKFEIESPKLREYVTNREHHLTELGKVLRGKDREHCKRLFLIATNTNHPNSQGHTRGAGGGCDGGGRSGTRMDWGTITPGVRLSANQHAVGTGKNWLRNGERRWNMCYDDVDSEVAVG